MLPFSHTFQWKHFTVLCLLLQIPLHAFRYGLSPLALHYLINFLTPFVPFFKSQIHNLKSTKCDTFFIGSWWRRKNINVKEWAFFSNNFFHSLIISSLKLLIFSNSIKFSSIHWEMSKDVWKVHFYDKKSPQKKKEGEEKGEV